MTTSSYRRISITTLIIILLLSTFGLFFSNASVIGINPKRIQAWLFDKEIKVSLNLWSEYAGIQPAKLEMQLIDQDGKNIYTGAQTLTLKPGHNHYYQFVISTDINTAKLYNYTLKYVLTTREGQRSEGAKNLFEIVPQLETHAVIPANFYPGTQASLRIVTRNHATGEALANAKVTISLNNANSNTSYNLYQGKTNDKGTLDVSCKIPQIPPKDTNQELVVKINSEIGEDIIKQSVIVKEEYKILVTTDKPLYQPGQTINLRALALRVPDLRPAANKDILVEISDSKGNKVFKEELTADKFGIVGTKFVLADEINMGLYGVKVTLGNTNQEKKVTVDKYVLPKYKIELKTDKKYYSPGDTIKGEIQSDYFFGKPVANGKVKISASKFEIQFDEFSQLNGQLDKNGHYKFEIKLPEYFAGVPLEQGKAQVKLDISVIDNADHQQDKTQMFSIAKDAVQIFAIPEAGVIKPKMENVIYILTSYPDGSPASCEVRGLNTPIRTNALGIGTVRITPGKETLALTLTAKDNQGNSGNKTFNFTTEPAEENILIHTNKALYRAGESLKLSARSQQAKGTLFIDLVKEGQTYLTQSVDIENNQAQLNLTLDETLVGNLLINAYIITQGGDIVRDSRWIYVNPANELNIKVTPDKSTYRPGDNASIRFNVTQSNGNASASALGIAIVDEAVFALQDMQPGLEKIYFMLEKEVMEPRYEIHGFEIDELVRLPQEEPVDFRINGWSPQQQQAAQVLMIPKVNPGIAPLAINTYKTKNSEYEKAMHERMNQVYERINRALQSYFNQYKHYPDKKDGIKELVTKRYLTENDLLDPWGTPVEVIVPNWTTQITHFSIQSYGPDGINDTKDDIEFNPIRAQFGEGFIFGRRKGAEQERMLMFDAARPMAMAAPSSNAVTKSIYKMEKDASGQTEEPRLRMYFPETLYFNPALLTDHNGIATLKTKMADSITAWRLTALGSNTQGQMGSISAPLRVFQDFFIDIDLPVTLTQNDQVSIPIAIYNYLPGPQKVKLVMETASWFELKDEAVKELVLKKDEVRAVYFTIKVKEIGNHPLKVTAYGEKMSDAIQRSIEVMPDGKETLVSFSERLTAKVAQTVLIPADAIINASKILVKIYPGILSQVVEGLDSMFRMPFGCFEQTSSVTYPNILVLKYLKDTKKATPEVEMKAKEYISIGYQRLLSFEVQGGGFEWFGNAPANQILTAWGVMEFSDMSKVHNVDPAVISRTQQWLLNKQNADGSWNPDAAYLHSESWGGIQKSKVLVTAYICWALAETGIKDPKLDLALNYIRNNYKDTQDPYTLALIANAAASYKPQDPLLSQVLNRLMTIKKEDKDKMWWETTMETVTYSHGGGANVEATALVALALMKSERDIASVSRIMNYLIAKKDANGNWGSTQATILTLKAMIMSLQNLTEKVNATINVKINGKTVDTIVITPKNSDVMRQLDLKEYTRTGDNQVELELQGEGSLLYQIVGKYYLPWKQLMDQQPPLSISVDYDKTTLAKEDLAKASITITNNRPGVANMVIVDLGIPPGFEVLSGDLDELVKNKTIEKYSMTPWQIIVYLTKIEKNKTLKFSYQLKAKYPIRAKTPSSQVYEYYNPEIKTTAKPVQITVN